MVMQLEGRGLGFRYEKGPWLFRGLHVTIRPGEVVGLMGPSGVGKTTLGRIMAGYERPTEGKVLLDGRPLTWQGYCPVQMVFQHPERAVNPRWTIDRIIKEGWQPPPSLLERMGIEMSWLSRFPHELSAGQLQRVCLVRALAPQTRFLIADELTAMLDALLQAQIFNVLLQVVKERKVGLLVISHDHKLIEKVCQRVIDWNDTDNFQMVGDPLPNLHNWQKM